uniref:Ig-like domain-containing protein n=1 Tax=Denticeps clupeoides TaxID=299321 RepID=A0AAY4DT33_9TELE
DRRPGSSVWGRCFAQWHLGVVMGGLQIIQEDPVFFRQEGASCFISCRTSGSPAYVHWYQKKDSEPFHEVLYSDHKGSTTHHDQNMKTDFKAKVLRGVFFLEVISAKLSHSATYHCAPRTETLPGTFSFVLPDMEV